MEDAHAVANSLTWGPDGWLYGVQGSTVTANIRGIEFQQGVWRYHPLTKEFELFSEGGGNNFGFDFDQFGNAFASGNEVETICHHVQGGYYIKGFSKHGPLHNPYTYGYLLPTKHVGPLGDSLSGGSVFYFADKLPARFRGACIAPHTRHNATRWSRVEVRGSTFETHHGGDFLTSPHTGFRPVDCLVGPDGAVYIADWYDLNISHSDPRDRTKYYPPRTKDGRIWKVTSPGNQGSLLSGQPLGARTTAELIDLLSNANSWYARQARVILAERKDRTAIPKLRELIVSSKSGKLALEALWAYYVTCGIDDQLSAELLRHPSEYVRAWAIRLLGDDHRLPDLVFPHVVRLSKEESSSVVRSQLASTAKRLPTDQALPVLNELLRHDCDLDDPHIPLLIWWAFEEKAVVARKDVLHLIRTDSLRKHPLVRTVVAPRLIKRYTAEQSDEGFQSCAQLLAAAYSAEDEESYFAAMEEQLQGHAFEHIPEPLKGRLDSLMRGPVSAVHLRLALRFGHEEAIKRALQVITDPAAADSDRLQLIVVVGESKRRECIPALLQLAGNPDSAEVLTASLQALARFDNPQIAQTMIKLFPSLNTARQQQACDILCSRPAWALKMLKAIADQKLPQTAVSVAQLRSLQLHKHPEINAFLDKLWGQVQETSAAEAQQRIAEIVALAGSGKGDLVAGKKVFSDRCSKCHQIFGEGTLVGPDLTGVERRRLDVLVANLVEPSGVIRPEYQSYVALTADGLVITGMMQDTSPDSITLVDGENKRTTLLRDDLEEINASPMSLMPEKLLDDLTDEQVLNLVTFLQSDQPE
jgi:putative heme-binding domain-containing protein